MYSPWGYTITERNSDKDISKQLKTKTISMESDLQIKRGNLGQMDAGPFSNLKMFITYHNSKLRSEYGSRDGGKIAEKANARNNSLDTRATPRIRGETGASIIGEYKFNVGGLLNSVCLNEVACKTNGSIKLVRDPFGARSKSTLSQSDITGISLEEQVEIKQRELVQLAKSKGVYDEEVLKKQLIMARSKLFREYAVELMRRKSGSQTPGVDKEIYDKENNQMYEELVEYLRQMIYHPNKYRAKPVKRV